MKGGVTTTRRREHSNPSIFKKQDNEKMLRDAMAFFISEVSWFQENKKTSLITPIEIQTYFDEVSKFFSLLIYEAEEMILLEVTKDSKKRAGFIALCLNRFYILSGDLLRLTRELKNIEKDEGNLRRFDTLYQKIVPIKIVGYRETMKHLHTIYS